MTTSAVRIADLKSRFSQHLRKERAGRSITVLDGSTSIARIVPYEGDGGALTIRHPLSGDPSLKQILLPPPLKLPRDIIVLLLEERHGQR
ncbi:MAG TPA: hypothetical protein PKD12_05730 [Nitrospira sp.]|nr:hypothetical protein [Nitrospira sp.]